MKKRLLPFILAVVLITAVFAVGPVFAAAGDKPFLGSLLGGGERFEQSLPAGDFTVTYNANGGSFSSEGTPLSTPVTVAAGSKIDEPVYPPSMTSKIFEGWFLDSEGRVAWDFNDRVYSNVTLYAKYNDGVKLYVASDEQMVIYSDAVKYNTERATDIANALKNEVRAKYLGEPVGTTISNYGTFKTDSSGLYPVGEHSITFRAEVGGLAKTLSHKVKVIDGPANKVYISTKASVQELGGTAFGYFEGSKNIGVSLDNYFDLNNIDDLTDYSVSNAVARYKLGLPRTLLSNKFTLKQFADPILIHNNTGENIWYRLNTVEHLDASFVLLDASGAFIEGYDGPNRYMFSEKYHNFDARLTSANATFLTDRELPDGYFLLVIGHNNNKGNFYKAKSAAGSAATTYDYDGRKFVFSAIMNHYKNMVEIRVGNPVEGTLLTAPYTNQKPYLIGGGGNLEAYIGHNVINKEYVTADLEVYDDNGVFARDTLVPANRVTVDFAVVEDEKAGPETLTYSSMTIPSDVEGIYYARITVADDSGNPDMKLITYKRVSMEYLVNNYSYFEGDQPFAHKHSTTEGVRFNATYSPYGGVDKVVYVFDNKATKFFNTYTAECQWSVILILKQDGSVVYAVSSQGEVYNAAGEKLYTISPQGNMVTNLYQKVINTTATPTDSTMRTFIASGAGTDSTGESGPYYLVAYPNTGASNLSRNYGNSFVAAFAANPLLKLTIKGTGVSIGV